MSMELLNTITKGTALSVIRVGSMSLFKNQPPDVPAYIIPRMGPFLCTEVFGPLDGDLAKWGRGLGMAFCGEGTHPDI
ncbi:MAG: hypothetical protein AB1576_11925 [Bacillota bacterium]